MKSSRPTQGQSRKGSFGEQLVNTAIGFVLSVLCQGIVFPLFGLNLPISLNVTVTGILTIVSIVRGYAVRRFFNWYHLRKHHDSVL